MRARFLLAALLAVLAVTVTSGCSTSTPPPRSASHASGPDVITEATWKDPQLLAVECHEATNMAREHESLRAAGLASTRSSAAADQAVVSAHLAPLPQFRDDVVTLMRTGVQQVDALYSTGVTATSVQDAKDVAARLFDVDTPACKDAAAAQFGREGYSDPSTSDPSTPDPGATVETRSPGVTASVTAPAGAQQACIDSYSVVVGQVNAGSVDVETAAMGATDENAAEALRDAVSRLPLHATKARVIAATQAAFAGYCAGTPTARAGDGVRGLPHDATLCGMDVGQRVAAGPGTSCDFALVVSDDYHNASTLNPVSVTSTSPVTGRSYTMRCSTDTIITCRGGTNAVVYIR